MFPFSLDTDVLIPLVAFAIPIVAITGGIIVGVVRAVGRQRMIELAQRERIAALERGVDPAKLPILDVSRPEFAAMLEDRHSSPLRRAQGLLIGGIVTLFAGIGISLFLSIIVQGEDRSRVWAVGLVPSFVGVALLLSSMIVWPRSGNPQA